MTMQKRAPLLLTVWAVVVTAASRWAAAKVAGAALDHAPFFYDPVGYQLYNVRVYGRLEEAGRLSVAAHEWLTNERYPLRTVPLILFAPTLLARPLGYLGTVLPMLAAFLVVLGWTVYLRSRNVLYAAA